MLLTNLLGRSRLTVVGRLKIPIAASRAGFRTSSVPCLKRPVHPRLSPLLRRRATTSTGQAEQRAKTLFPERLLIYHAGTGRTTFLACLKLTTLFTFCFFTFFITPAYVAADEPAWKAAGVALCGIVPFAFVAYSTTPFVAFIHLRLPAFARQSREILERFAENVPGNTQIAITTMNLIGKPRVSEMAVSELHAVRERLGMVNFARSKPPTVAAKKWYSWAVLPPGTKFNITPQIGGTKHDWIWKEIAETIAKRGLPPRR